MDQSGMAALLRTEPRPNGAVTPQAAPNRGERISLPMDPARHAYLVPATGAVDVGGIRIDAREGVAINDVDRIDIVVLEDAEVLLIDAA
jgi:redox-sensitive bicupin YhaK (pirin superfamily)